MESIYEKSSTWVHPYVFSGGWISVAFDRVEVFGEKEYDEPDTLGGAFYCGRGTYGSFSSNMEWQKQAESVTACETIRGGENTHNLRIL